MLGQRAAFDEILLRQAHGGDLPVFMEGEGVQRPGQQGQLLRGALAEQQAVHLAQGQAVAHQLAGHGEGLGRGVAEGKVARVRGHGGVQADGDVPGDGYMQGVQQLLDQQGGGGGVGIHIVDLGVGGVGAVVIHLRHLRCLRQQTLAGAHAGLVGYVHRDEQVKALLRRVLGAAELLRPRQHAQLGRHGILAEYAHPLAQAFQAHFQRQGAAQGVAVGAHMAAQGDGFSAAD